MATTKLTDTHLVILSQAAQRPKLRVLPTPESLKADAGAVTRALKVLLKRGFIAEQQARKSTRSGGGTRAAHR
jgi:DNA-binding MarR family transcriptional regulator